MEKKASHVGIMLSFVIFIIFIIFLWTITQPAIKTGEDKQYILDYLKTELVNKFSADLTVVSVSASGAEECVRISVEDNDLPTELEMIVKDSDENNIPAEKGNDYVSFRMGDNFKIYFTYEELNPIREFSGDECVNGTINWMRTRSNIFETKILDAKDNFETLKNNLELPGEANFGFSFKKDDKTEISTEDINVPEDIYAEEFPVNYIDKYANLKQGFITIKVW